VTTLEKIRRLVDEMRTVRPGEVDPSMSGLVEMLQILTGLGFDPLSYLLPETEADADQLVDGLITLALEVRGDDLPAYDLERHVRDATAASEG
jgi:hypothetical protein